MKRQLINSAAVFLHSCPGCAARGEVVAEHAVGIPLHYDGFLTQSKIYLLYSIRGGDD